MTALRKFVGASTLLVTLAGCSAHHKPKPAHVVLVPPPTLKQTPLYPPEMEAHNTPVPDLPRPQTPQATPTPPAQPEPKKKPVRHLRPPTPKPAPSNEAQDKEPAPASPTGSSPAAAQSAPLAATPSPDTQQAAVVKTPTEPASDASPIGQLTSGPTAGSAENSGEMKRETADLIQGAQKGVGDIHRALSADEKKTVTQIRNFLQQAQRALESGDTDGAHTLATKAKLMLDELNGGG